MREQSINPKADVSQVTRSNLSARPELKPKQRKICASNISEYEHTVCAKTQKIQIQAEAFGVQRQVF